MSLAPCAALPLLLLAVGCGGGNETGDTSPLDEPGLEDLPSLEEVSADLSSREECETFTNDLGETFRMAGLSVYYVGRLGITDEDDMVGTEHMLLYPTPYYVETKPDEARECKIPWNVAGQRGPLRRGHHL